MIKIHSDGEDIFVKTGRGDMVVNLIFELAQVCNAVIGSLAHDAGSDPDALRRALLYILQTEEPDLEFLGSGPGDLNILDN